jgi:hypothetical protein
MRVIQGVRSQSHPSFTNIGVQCTAVAAVSCCKASVKKLSEWNVGDIEECLEVNERVMCRVHYFDIVLFYCY